MTPRLDRVTPFADVGTGTSLNFTFSTNPMPGSKILVPFWLVNQPFTGLAVTDNATPPNSYQQDASYIGSAAGSFVYRSDYILLPSAGALVVTVSLTNQTYIQGCAASFVNIQAGAPESTAGATDTGVRNVNTSPSTGKSPNDLYIAVMAASTSNPNAQISTSGPFLQLAAEQNGSTQEAGAASYAVTPSAPQSCVWNSVVAIGATYDVIAAYKTLFSPFNIAPLLGHPRQ